MKKLLTILLALSMVLSLAACGTEPTEPPMTAQDVYAAAAEAAGEPTKMTIDMEFSLSYTVGEGAGAVTTTIEYGMAMDIVMAEDPFQSYNASLISISTQGFSMDQEVVMHTVVENGTVVTYAQIFGSWIRTDSKMTVAEYLASEEASDLSAATPWNSTDAPADLTMDTEQQTVDGHTVYILRCSLPVPSLTEAFSDMGLDISASDLDTAMPVVLYVDAQDHTIIRMDIGMAGLMQAVCNSLVESILGDDTEGITIDFEMSDVIYTLGYGTQEVPPVPQEALDNAVSDDDFIDVEEDTFGENGPVLLDMGGQIYELVPPENCYAESIGYTYVWLFDEDSTFSAEYYYYSDYTREDLYFIYQSNVEFMQEAEYDQSHGDGPAVEGYESYQITDTDGWGYYYLFREAGDGYFLLCVTDYVGTADPHTLISGLLDYLVPYAGE